MMTILYISIFLLVAIGSEAQDDSDNENPLAPLQAKINYLEKQIANNRTEIMIKELDQIMKLQNKNIVFIANELIYRGCALISYVILYVYNCDSKACCVELLLRRALVTHLRDDIAGKPIVYDANSNSYIAASYHHSSHGQMYPKAIIVNEMGDIETIKKVFSRYPDNNKICGRSNVYVLTRTDIDNELKNMQLFEENPAFEHTGYVKI